MVTKQKFDGSWVSRRLDVIVAYGEGATANLSDPISWIDGRRIPLERHIGREGGPVVAHWEPQAGSSLSGWHENVLEQSGQWH